MTLQFSGWEVIKHYHELKPSQKPSDRQVYTMYHGTSADSARSIITGGFRPSTEGMLGPGVYVSRNIKKAENYPRPGLLSLIGLDGGKVILKVRVSVGRVKRIDKDNHELQFTWHKEGFDTAWVPPKCGMTSVRSGLEEDCVYDPKNVEVTGIAKASSALLYQELSQLLEETQRSNKPRGSTPKCPACKKPILDGSQHTMEQCWGCSRNICVFMDKHFCAARQ